MSVEVSSGKSVVDAQSASPLFPAQKSPQCASPAPKAEEEAYKTSITGEKRNQFEVGYGKIKAMKAESRKGYAAFRQMVAALLEKQGKSSHAVFAKIFGEGIDFEGVTDLEKMLASLEVDGATRAEAASLIGEDGPLGVNRVSKNILEFAKAASGGDPAQIEKMKAAFLKGFSDAERVWGGALPAICRKTKEAVLSGFKDWANAASREA